MLRIAMRCVAIDASRFALERKDRLKSYPSFPLRCVHASDRKNFGEFRDILANHDLDATQRKALRQYCEFSLSRYVAALICSCLR